jgi:HK97 family phage prohead protease
MNYTLHDGTQLRTVETPTDSIDDFGMLTCVVAKSANAPDESRVRRFVASTAMRDRYGDEVMVDAWDTKHYEKNPVFLWAHNYGELPLGKAVNIERTDKALLIDVEFAPASAQPKAEQVLQLYDGGFMCAVSVGFRSKASEWIDTANEDEAKLAKKDPDVRPGKRFTRVELLELSAVPVPANPQALMQMRNKGLAFPEARNFFYYNDNSVRADGADVRPVAVIEEPTPVKSAQIEGEAATDQGALAACVTPPASGQPAISANQAEALLMALTEAIAIRR